MPIEVANIVGTAGRNMEFDRNFLPRRSDVHERWRRLERAYPDSGFPPIIVYKLNDMYFVVDGHHRVAIAKQKKVDFIDAEVTELHPRRALPEGLDLGRIIFAEQERIFLEESGLTEALPDVNIEFSKPDGYPELLELIQMYGYRLMMERNEVVTPPAAAEHWFEDIYMPAVEAIRNENLHEIFPRATEADLYLLVHQRRLALFPERGYVSMEDMARESEGTRDRPARAPGRTAIDGFGRPITSRFCAQSGGYMVAVGAEPTAMAPCGQGVNKRRWICGNRHDLVGRVPGSRNHFLLAQNITTSYQKGPEIISGPFLVVASRFRTLGEEGRSPLRVDLVPLDGLADLFRFHLSRLGQGSKHRHHDVLLIDLEMPPESLASVRPPEPVGTK